MIFCSMYVKCPDLLEISEMREKCGGDGVIPRCERIVWGSIYPADSLTNFLCTSFMQGLSEVFEEGYVW